MFKQEVYQKKKIFLLKNKDILFYFSLFENVCDTYKKGVAPWAGLVLLLLLPIREKMISNNPEFKALKKEYFKQVNTYKIFVVKGTDTFHIHL